VEDLSLHILDVVENATAAGATLVEIRIREDSARDLLTLSIRDNGRGMAPEMLAKVKDPFVTTRTTRRVGLGLPLLEQSAREADGELTVDSAPGQGTRIVATFKASHIDRKPLGDIAETLVALIMGNPEIDFDFEADLDGRRMALDTREIRAELEGVSIADPAVVKAIRNLLRSPGRRVEDG
jgi:hypothetical protein